MSYSRQDYFLRSSIASQLIGDDDSGPAAARLQELAKEPESGKTVTLGLDQNVDDSPMLIDRTPEIVLDSVDLQEHFV